MEWRVGQKVVVSDTQGKLHDGEVVKLGRINMQVRWGYNGVSTFGQDGRGKDPRHDFGQGLQVYTVEQAAEMAREKAARVALRELGITVGWGASVTADQLEAILKIVSPDA
jgi:hypothetical protein